MIGHTIYATATLGALAIATIGAYQLGAQSTTKDWSNVIVVRDGSAVANPDALTPEELAGSDFLTTRPRYIATRCRGEHPVMFVDKLSDGLALCAEVRTMGDS